MKDQIDKLLNLLELTEYRFWAYRSESCLTILQDANDEEQKRGYKLVQLTYSLADGKITAKHFVFIKGRPEFENRDTLPSQQEELLGWIFPELKSKAKKKATEILAEQYLKEVGIQ